MAFSETVNHVRFVTRGLDRCEDGELDPCAFYNRHEDKYSWFDADRIICDNKNRRGFSNCPKDKRRCCKDMLCDIFDAVDMCYEGE